jgi:hypothetical protein
VGHRHFRGGPYAKAKPDFLVHVPGAMDHNLAAVEVTPATADTNDLRADLQKLTWFCQHAQYFRGLLLVYGEAGERSLLQEKLRRAADQYVDRAVVMTLYHRNVQPALTWRLPCASTSKRDPEGMWVTRLPDQAVSADRHGV